MQKNKKTAKLNNYSKYEIEKIKFFTRQRKKAVSHQQTSSAEKEDSAPNVFDKYGTWSDRIGVVVNIVVAVVTLFLFAQTKKATDAAVRSANTADSTFKETQKQFMKLNQPKLQLDTIFFLKFKAGQAIVYRVKVINTSSADVEIIRYCNAAVFRVRRIFEDVFSDCPPQEELPIYVNSNFPFTSDVITNRVMSQGENDYLMRNKISFYIKGRIEYRNTIDDHHYYYNFQIQTVYDSTMGARALRLIESRNVRIESGMN